MHNYDKNYPLDTTLVKDLPASIRKKGEELYNLITDIENNRNTSSIKTAIDSFPFMKELFVSGNTDIPRGLYFNHGDYWIGYSDYESLPTDVDSIEIGKRVTIDNNTFELRETEEIKAWVVSRSFQPVLFYDLFEYQGEEVVNLNNRGLYKENIPLTINNMIKASEIFMFPYLIFTKASKMYTNKAFISPYSFTYTAMFDEISRTYYNDEIMNESHYAALMYIRDEFSNINICLAYDKYNHLFFFNKDKKTDLNITLSENLKYQISFQYINEHLDIYLDNTFIKSFPIILKDKMLYFAIGHDMDYGRFCEGSFIVTEPTVYKEALSNKELLHIKNFPRTWNLSYKDSYLDLTLEEKIKLKELLNIEMLKEE